MKKLVLLTSLMAVSITGLKALPTYNDGDVFLGFRDKTASAAYVVDLGLLDNFLTAAANKVNLTTADFGFSSANLSADLTANLGAGWFTNANVVYGLYGGYQAGSSSSFPNLPDNALIVGNVSTSVFGNIADQTIGGLTGYASGIGGNIQGTTQNVAQAWVAANTTTGSWASYQYGGPANANNNNGSLAYNWQPFSLETKVANSLYVNSVYSIDPSFNNGFLGSKLGTFSVANNGAIAFTVVPEPSTYMLLGLGAILIFVARKRFSKVS